MTDPIADFLTRIRNAITAAHQTVDIPASRLKREMARILTEQGYIDGFDVEAPNAEHPGEVIRVDRKSTRLNSSHANISYAVFCLKKTSHTNISYAVFCLKQ